MTGPTSTDPMRAVILRQTRAKLVVLSITTRQASMVSGKWAGHRREAVNLPADVGESIRVD